MPVEPQPSISEHDDLPAAEAAVVDAGLDASNAAAAALDGVRPLSCFVRGPSGEVIGGAVGRTWGACCESQQLWVDPGQRRQGLGARLVRAFEARAQARGCRTVYLTTFSFQAPAFYRSLGYRSGHELSGFAPGIAKFLMLRTLAAAPVHSVVPAAGHVEAACERVLRSLPMWFGKEDSLQEYVRDTATLPTFVTLRDGAINGFISVRRHFAPAFEIHCMAVHADSRGAGFGRALVEHVEAWAQDAGGRLLQVKTVGAGSPSAAYAQTRAFYARMGFVPLESLPIWDERNPCLQLVKPLPGSG